MTNILQMTHEELMSSTEEIRKEYRFLKKLEFFNIVKNYLESGYSHIQIGNYSCIIIKKNKNGFYYVTRNGKGTGCNTGEFIDLMDATNSLYSSGHYSRYTIITFK
jgi:hypothetical protein